MSGDKEKASGKSRPGLTPAAEATKRARETRLAAELRANLQRRKADLVTRGIAGEPGEGEPEG